MQAKPNFLRLSRIQVFRDMRNSRPDDAFDENNRVVDCDYDGVPIGPGAQYVWDVFSLVRAFDKQMQEGTYLNVEPLYRAAGVSLADARLVTGRDSKQLHAVRP